VPNSLPGGNGAITNTGLVAWSSLPGNFNAPQSFTPNVQSTERFYDPLSQINIYGAQAALTLTPLGGSSGSGGNANGAVRGSEAARRGAVLIPITGFAPGKVTDLSGLPVTTYNTSNNLTLDIPKLTLKMPIVGVALNNGTWDVTWLLDHAGWLEQTAFPTFNGNSVVTGHVTLSNGDPGPFAKLSTLSPGDDVFVHAFGQLYVYQVRTIKTVNPDDISIFGHEDKSWLTLVTCGNYSDVLGVYLNRTVVRAELIQTQPDPTLGQ
jgi:LPXTG-site transpeptidase (sortase) family protein